MIQQDVLVTNPLGIHARPASLIVQKATSFDCEITLEKQGVSANAKSIMSVMMLAAACDTKITIKANGKDEQMAIETLVKLFESKFNEG